MTLKELFEDIADAIREKDGTTAPIVPTDFPARIRAIPAGIGGVQLESISITAPPTKRIYIAGETFDPTGMAVWATYSNGQSMYVNHSNLTFDPSGPLEEGTTSVTVNFQWGLKMASASQPVSVVSHYTIESPHMTSNTSPAPYIVSASSVYSGGYYPWCAFDDNNSTSWAPSSTEVGADNRKNIWLQFDFGVSAELIGVELTSRNIYTYQMPISITLALSDDGINYTDYMTITTDPWGASETRLFLFQEKVHTKIVRFKNLITQNDPSLGSYYQNICIAEVRFVLAPD